MNFDEEESIFHDSKPKNVSFDRIVNVTLIPTVNEYIDNNLKKQLWWSHDDYDLFIKREYASKYHSI